MTDKLNQIVSTRYVLVRRNTASKLDRTFDKNPQWADKALIPLVTGARYDPQVPTVVTMTLGSHVTEFSHKNRIGDLVLTGDVGPHIYGMKEQALSYSMFQSLSTLIADGLLSDNPEFVLYMFDEGFVYNVVPIKLSFSRNSRNKIGLQYDLAFKLFGTVDAVITINEPAIAKKAIDQTWLDKASKQISETMVRLQSIAANINSFQASVVKITNKIVSSIQDAIDT